MNKTTEKPTVGDGSFKLTMPIAKSYEKEVEGVSHKYVAGVASGTGLDLDYERMAETAITAFKNAVDEGIVLPNGKWSLVPLRSGHRKEWDDVLGWITKAEVDGEHNLWIEAELDDDSPVAQALFRKLTQPEKPGRPLQLGFSVGGTIRKASREWDANLNRAVRVIEDVMLKEISVVGSPAYPTAYVEALSKSVDWEALPPTVEELERENTMKDVQKAAEQENNNAVTTTEETVVTTTDSTQVVPAVETTPEEVDKADPQDALRADVTKLMGDVSMLADAFKVFAEAHPVVKPEAEKAKVVETDTTVTEKAETPIEDRIAAAVASALSSFKTDTIDPIMTEMQAVKSTVEEIASEPVGKAFAVRVSKETDTALEKFQSRVQSNKDHGSIIGSAVRVALNVDE
jgi:HK97 family phage prohead protease